MNPIFIIGHNDARMFLAKKSSYVWLIVMPMIFVYFLGFLIHGPGAPGNRRPPVLIENADTNFLSAIFLDELGAQGMDVVGPKDNRSASGEIRIPADFTSLLLQHKPAKVQFLQRPDSAEGDAAIIRLRLLRSLVSMNSHLHEASARSNAAHALTESQLRAVLAAPDPVSLDARFAGRRPVPSGFSFSLPGSLVMYLMLNLLVFGGAILSAERQSGVIKRLAVCPIHRGQLVMGKIYGLVLLGVAQMAFFLAAGKLLFHLNLGANLPVVTLVLLEYSWVAASLGVLIGSVISSENRVVGLCVLSSLMMSALGGCFWPLEITPPAMKTIGLCLPTGWALQALHQLISFGGGLNQVLKPMAVLAGFGAAANLLAARFFRS